MIHDMLEQAAYMAHGYCLLWKPWLVGLHAGSDFLIFAAYSAIPVAIWIFVSRRPHVEMKGLAIMFAAFILWCGMTHLVNLLTLWWPIYEFQGAVKAITAGISVATAAMIFPLIPKALAIPSPAELQRANKRLAAEIEAHRQTLVELQTARDELEQRVVERTRALDAMSSRFRLLFERAPVAMVMMDRDGRIKQANASAEELLCFEDGALDGMSARDLLPEEIVARLPDLTASVSLEAKSRGSGTDLVARTRHGTQVPVEVGLNPMEFDGQLYVIASIVDLTERRQREEQIKLLMREVNHRSKNMLGVVQSIARHTAASDPKDFSVRFSARVRALGASQDLLIESDWRGAEMADLVRSQLGHFHDLIGSRIRLSGPRLRLTPSAAQTIGMALHELATNAGKYGALSNATGIIHITWSQEGAGDSARLSICWKERGGPPVEAPARRGFGMTVIEPMARIGLSADVKLDFAADGLLWCLDAPGDKAIERLR